MNHRRIVAEPQARRSNHLLAITYRPLKDLELDPGNARVHSKKQIRQLARSIEEFGFNIPVVVDAKRKVIAGHCRIEACRHLGWTEVPTICLDHLTEAQARAFAIADNRLSELSSLDDGLDLPRFSGEALAHSAAVFSNCAGLVKSRAECRRPEATKRARRAVRGSD